MRSYSPTLCPPPADWDRERVRVVGSAISPNGIGLSDQAMLNMAQCNRMLNQNAVSAALLVPQFARLTSRGWPSRHRPGAAGRP